ncbi:MAG: sarcosine oxidase subunit gamma family protein [Chitinophagaceae bacterium]
MNTGTADTVVIRELPGLHTIDLRVAPGSLSHAAIAEALGIDLAGKNGKTGKVEIPGGGEAYTLCLAPDWWLLVGFREVEQQLAALRLNDNYHFSVVDVSVQRTTFELEGPNAREVFAHLWEQDLREKTFPVGSVSQGLMAKAPVIVFHIAPNRYRVMVRSSFAGHLWKAVGDAGEEWL